MATRTKDILREGVGYSPFSTLGCSAEMVFVTGRPPLDLTPRRRVDQVAAYALAHNRACRRGSASALLIPHMSMQPCNCAVGRSKTRGRLPGPCAIDT